jgi:dTDP-glucose pyrophosphorylase
MAIADEIQVIIPMAGSGSRFADAGYETAKPLLPVHGQPMFLVVAANLLSSSVSRIVVIAQQSFGIGGVVERMRDRISQQVDLIEIDFLTDGPADTVDLAREYLTPELPVVTANSDQFVDHSMEPLYAQLGDPDVAGSILTMKDNDPKWSYAATDSNGDVLLVREKEVISEDATVGVYGFRSAHLMWEGFDAMRAAGDTVNGEYYVAPAYNHLIRAGHRIVTFGLGPITATMHGMGIPRDYETFLRSPASLRAAELSRSIFGDV